MPKSTLEKTEVTRFFKCECSTVDHHVIWNWDSDPEWNDEVCVQVFLSEKPWYRRVWPAICYMFGYKSKTGHWVEFILGRDKVEELRNLCDDVLQAHQR